MSETKKSWQHDAAEHLVPWVKELCWPAHVDAYAIARRLLTEAKPVHDGDVLTGYDVFVPFERWVRDGPGARQ